MAFGAGSNWAIWTTGAAGNGGGFDPSCTGFATDGVIASGTGSAPTLTSASYTFVAGDVGAWIFFPAAGTAIAGWYVIASVAAGVATMTASIGSAQLLGPAGSYKANHPIGANTVAGCNTQASPTGVTWGVDYSQQASAKISFTDMVIAVTTTQFTSVANPAGPNMVGNIINVTAGTGFTVQRVEVVSFTAAGLLATCDKSLGTTASTGGTGALGGAVAILTTVSGLGLAGNYFAIKATGTYTLGATWTIGSAVKGDTTNGRIVCEGYTTIRGARDGRPLITSSTNSVALITLNDNDYWEFCHLKGTHTAATRGAMFSPVTSISSPIWLKDIVCGTLGGGSPDGCLSLFLAMSNISSAYLEGVEVCKATSAVSAITNVNVGLGSTISMRGCYIHDSAAAGCKWGNVGTTAFITDSIFALNTGISIDLQTVTSNAITLTVQYCTFVDNTGDDIKLPNDSSPVLIDIQNNIAYNTTGWWINNGTAQMTADQNVRIIRNNFLGANSSGNYNALTPGIGDVALTADPFVNKANRNYALNATAGGGAAIRAMGFPVSWGGVPDTLNYRAGGAAQPQDTPVTSVEVVNVAVLDGPTRTMGY